MDFAKDLEFQSRIDRAVDAFADPRASWVDLVWAEKMAAPPPAVQPGVSPEEATRRLDRAIGQEIDWIRNCGDCTSISREELVRQLEKASHIGFVSGKQQGTELARQRARWLRIKWFVIGALVAAPLVIAWLR